MSAPDVEPIRLYNTLTREVEDFVPIQPGRVGIYACGPTVYNFAHIGNLRTYVSEDFIRRAFEVAGYEVRHVMNITDVGHLEHDDIEAGEDKMSLAARRESRSPWEIARAYEEAFFDDSDRLGIRRPEVVCRATEHVDQMIEMVQAIERRGHTYEVDGNVYFSIDTFPEYGAMARLALDSEDVARVEVDERKRNPRDFVLWFSQSKFPNQIMQWDSPWGRGFPGWHIECSAMASHYLGERIDLHMGGTDHVPVHHTNEIAQSEGAFGHKWVNYWLHCAFLIVSDGKMAKSAGNFLRLQTLEDRGFSASHYRYMCASATYRSPLTFHWDALASARDGFEALKNRVVSWKHRSKRPADSFGPAAEEYRSDFWSAAWNDFNVPRCLGILWSVAKDEAVPPAEKLAIALDFDRLLGFGVADFARPDLPEALLDAVRRREAARSKGEWAEADRIRDELLAQGVQLKDTADGTDWYRVPSD